MSQECSNSINVNISKNDDGKPKYPRTVLQRQLDKKKYFDSGDYQMARNFSKTLKTSLNYSTGERIPTPETVPARKTSLIQTTKYNVKDNTNICD